MLLTDSYGLAPGLTSSRETYESEFRWGSQFQGVFSNALISGATVDNGNTPSYELRPGLLLGQQLVTGKYAQYNPVASDGTEVAAAILIEALRMQDFTGVNVDRFYAVLVGGPVQGSKILGLDNMARQQMDKFIFDDIFNIVGNHWFPWKRFQTKTANYSLVAGDNYSIFDNNGASGAVTFTLPLIANGYMLSFRVQANQNVLVTSNEGGNIIAFNNAAANTISFQTGGQLIGGLLYFYTNPAGNKWFVENASAGTNTVTVA